MKNILSVLLVMALLLLSIVSKRARIVLSLVIYN